ncbi:MAG TPA: hypothetical protein VIV62_06030 [Chthoniobacterales bacterium]|jgi:hypothetical protein
MAGSEHLKQRLASWATGALHFCWRVLDLLRELSACRFAFLMILLGAAVFFMVDQGTEVLRALAERGSHTATTNVPRILLFAAGLLMWSIASWYTTRVLLYLDLDSGKRRPLEPSPGWDAFHRTMRCHAPRILGVVPLLIVGIAFFRATTSYESAAPLSLWVFGGASVAGAILLYLFFIWRRKWFDLGDIETPSAEQQTVRQLARESRIAIWIMAAISTLLTLLFVFAPLPAAARIGTGGVLMFAAASWVFWGSALVYLGGHGRLPILTLLLLWIAVCSLTNDNHDVRVAPRDPFQRLTLSQALDKWHENVAKYPPPHPLFIVAAEGGGIRAAYWTAAVLGTIQDERPTFAEHVFAISGVSGGSVGATVFDALVAEGPGHGRYAERAEEMLGRDFLSPAIAAMLYPDFLQRFWPCPVSYLDRGRWLEKSWENAWHETIAKIDKTNSERFAQPFFDLWATSPNYVPVLCLNGTSVETGNRIVVSNILVDGKEFLDVDDATRKILPLDSQEDEAKRSAPAIDMPLSTAAHLSARFTYVSPAGRFTPDGTHVVDGGYFENSGTTTALDILRQVTSEIADPKRNLSDVVPKIIVISNNPVAAFAQPEAESSPSPAPEQAVTTQAEEQHEKPGTFLEDALAPVYALLKVREARGTYAQYAIGKAQSVFYEKTGIKPTAAEDKQVYLFSLAPADVPLPLGWMLSNRAALAMNAQLNDEGKSKRNRVKTWNKPMRDLIVASLPTPSSTPTAR